MNEWIDELSDLSAAGKPAVLVTVARIRGSAPREAGARMIVTETESIGTIGGGQLEHQCVHIAAGLLGGDETPVLRTFPLGPALGQCCGGVVDILFEPIASGLPDWLRDLRAIYGQRQPAVLVTDTREGGSFIVTGEAVFAAGGNDACRPCRHWTATSAGSTAAGTSSGRRRRTCVRSRPRHRRSKWPRCRRGAAIL